MNMYKPMKEKIKQLEDISVASQVYFTPQKVAEKALVIIKKQEKALEIAINELNYCSHNSGSAILALKKINKLLEENE